MFEDKKWDKTFKNRLAKHYDELKWLYSELSSRLLTTSAT